MCGKNVYNQSVISTGFSSEEDTTNKIEDVTTMSETSKRMGNVTVRTAVHVSVTTFVN